MTYLHHLESKDATAIRDERQLRVRDWVIACFGDKAQVSTKERVERLFEEVVELAQAEGLNPYRLREVMRVVYSKEPGDPPQEVGGISTTLLAYCDSKGLSADQCERDELTRILSLPPQHFKDRMARKIASGLALTQEYE